MKVHPCRAARDPLKGAMLAEQRRIGGILSFMASWRRSV